MPFLLRLLAVLGLCLGLRAALAAGPPPLQLDGGLAAVDGWPAVSLLSDPSHRLTLAEVLQRRADFAVPDVPAGNLGRRADAVWLRLPLQAAQGGRWVMEIDYPSLNRVDVFLLADGRLQASHRLGNDQPFSQRPLKARVHAVAIELEAGRAHELLLRVRTDSTMLLPITFHRDGDFGQHEARRQLLQGLLLGVLLALLVYCAVNGLGLRDPLFALYGALLLGMAVFFTAYTGIGQQHLWDEQTGLMALVAPLGVLLSIVASGPFFVRALATQVAHPWITRGLHAVSALAAAAMLASLVGVLDYGRTQTASTLLGPVPLVLALRPAVIQARRGSAVARMVLVGWGGYLVGALVMAALLRGLLPATFWTQHGFQLAMLFEMLAWMRVLGLRVQAVRQDAERAERDRHHLHSLAHTDALTGLPNRRGLHEALALALSPGPGGAGTGRLLAVYMLDLDGFKPINDHLGHDAGDTLLIQLGQRLRGQLRSGDLVARLGGDEFVVMASSLADEADAQALGRKLLEAVAAPFQLSGQPCSVGLTIGYALAPADGRDARNLLMRADEAMYAGKQAGRRCVRRWVAAPVDALVTPAAAAGRSARRVDEADAPPLTLPG